MNFHGRLNNLREVKSFWSRSDLHDLMLMLRKFERKESVRFIRFVRMRSSELTTLVAYADNGRMTALSYIRPDGFYHSPGSRRRRAKK